MLLFVASSLSEGAMTTYIMGSGQDKRVDRREVIYHTESGIPMKPWSDKKIESFLNSKRQLFENKDASSNKIQKVDYPPPSDSLPWTCFHHEPVLVANCPVSPPSSLPCDAFPTAPDENVSRMDSRLSPCYDASPVEPVMDPFGFVESLSFEDMREMLGVALSPVLVGGTSEIVISNVDSVPGLASLSLDVTDDESCSSDEGDPERQKLVEFLVCECGY